ncbi:hypothetical protein SETIT_8G109600v2 [Setaria italica]|uniref:Uncharacterized protein n=1 Tax=Setaria italica TaxID=4555 RepID=A0A368S6I0_SETIT|nr:hypothetical protein SETIT_8G109600v2 [Setaria italica]
MSSLLFVTLTRWARAHTTSRTLPQSKSIAILNPNRSPSLILKTLAWKQRRQVRRRSWARLLQATSRGRSRFQAPADHACRLACPVPTTRRSACPRPEQRTRTFGEAVAGRRKNEMFKGAAESNGNTTRRKGHHRYDICRGFGHH